MQQTLDTPTDGDDGGEGAPEAKRFDAVDSNGPNSRPRHDTIAGTGPGVPDDTSAPPDLDPEEEKRIADSIRRMPGGG